MRIRSSTLDTSIKSDIYVVGDWVEGDVGNISLFVIVVKILGQKSVSEGVALR